MTTAAANSISVTLQGANKATIEWGDGVIDADEVISPSATKSHNYGNAIGRKTIRIYSNDPITLLTCNYGSLVDLDASKNPALSTLNITSNQITEINLTRNKGLQNLNCAGNRLIGLDLKRNTMLTSVNCGYNQLSRLNLERNTALTSVDCGSNNMNANSLRSLFESLPTISSGTINVTDNISVADLYTIKAIATGKNWTVSP